MNPNITQRGQAATMKIVDRIVVQVDLQKDCNHYDRVDSS